MWMMMSEFLPQPNEHEPYEDRDRFCLTLIFTSPTHFFAYRLFFCPLMFFLFLFVFCYTFAAQVVQTPPTCARYWVPPTRSLSLFSWALYGRRLLFARRPRLLKQKRTRTRQGPTQKVLTHRRQPSRMRVIYLSHLSYNTGIVYLLISITDGCGSLIL